MNRNVVFTYRYDIPTSTERFRIYEDCKEIHSISISRCRLYRFSAWDILDQAAKQIKDHEIRREWLCFAYGQLSSNRANRNDITKGVKQWAKKSQ